MSGLDIKLIVNYYRAYICHQPEVVGRWQNIGPRRSRGPIFVTCPQLRAGGRNICPVIINNKQYCQFTLYFIWYSASFLQVYCVFKFAAGYGNLYLNRVGFSCWSWKPSPCMEGQILPQFWGSGAARRRVISKPNGKWPRSDPSPTTPI